MARGRWWRWSNFIYLFGSTLLFLLNFVNVFGSNVILISLLALCCLAASPLSDKGMFQPLRSLRSYCLRKRGRKMRAMKGEWLWLLWGGRYGSPCACSWACTLRFWWCGRRHLSRRSGRWCCSRPCRNLASLVGSSLRNLLICFFESCIAIAWKDGSICLAFWKLAVWWVPSRSLISCIVSRCFFLQELFWYYLVDLLSSWRYLLS